MPTGHGILGLIVVGHRTRPPTGRLRGMVLGCRVPMSLGWTLLGPVRLVAGGSAVDLGTAKQRGILAMLLLTPRQAVPVSRLIGGMWDDSPPRSANAVAPYITRLRRVFDTVEPGQSWLRYGDGGYLIDCDPGQVDLHRVRRLGEELRVAPTGEAAARLLAELRRWQPVALAGVPGSWAERVRDELAHERLSWYGRWAGAGRHDDVVGHLAPLAGENLTVEGLIAPLMVALAGSGRSAEALTWYARARSAIREELGSEPSPDLQSLHLRILREDPAVTSTAVSVPGYRPLVPKQLPADVPGFAGRAAHLDRLHRLLDAPGQALAVVSGPPGVGKTALATHWAHRVRDRFPDGQLYVNLRGFDANRRSAAVPADAVRAFLEAFGVLPERIPAAEDARVAMYRSVMAGKRALLVLDNARDAGQVRPLLPGEPGCAVVVTSRARLTGLAVTEGAHPVLLDVLKAGEARDLLARRVGDDRVKAEPGAVDEIATACGRLPLALAVTAARAAVRPEFSMVAIASELRDAHSRLDVLTGTDPATNVRTVFSWSYGTLSPDAARVFRLLGLHPAAVAGTYAIASLAGLPVGRTRQLLVELGEASLLTEQAPGRFGCHDLLRDYARDLAGERDPASGRDAAIRRLVDHYLHTALAATALLGEDRTEVRSRPPAAVADVTPEPIRDAASAQAWFATEQPVLRLVVEHAAAARLDARTWWLAWAMVTYFERRSDRRDWVATQEIALAAAERIGDLGLRAVSHYMLGFAHGQDGDDDRFREHLMVALPLYRELGYLDWAAQSHINLGVTARRMGRYREALDEAGKALALYRELGDQAGQARALNNAGFCHLTAGEYELALSHCGQAVAMHEAVGNRWGAAHAWDSVGTAHYRLGRYDEALTCYGHALEYFREQRDLQYQAIILTHIGDARHAAGQEDAARDDWRQGLAIFAEIGHSDADEVRAKLAMHS
jgi:DNA-binding SARP family transcriptional activator/tetratricopeptide (TPR) repeat protein